MFFNRREIHSPRLAARDRGFSFIEVMIVIVIIGLLASVVTLSTRHQLDKAKQTRARTDIATYKSGLESYYAEVGRYPTSEEGLAVLVPRFIEKLRLDAWGHPYQYDAPGRNAPYDVICFGADGREGGEGINADLSSDDDEKVQKAN